MPRKSKRKLNNLTKVRKRRSSDSLEGDRKRIIFERYDCGSYNKREYNDHFKNKGRQNHSAVPNHCYTPAVPVIIKSKVVCTSEQYHYNQPYKSADKGDVFLSNYKSIYDNRRQRNVKPETYIDSLLRPERRHVNFYDLRRHLSSIDIRCFRNGDYSTALDLTLELESSLKDFVDIRNELVFLRKLKHHHHLSFSYNEVNITSRNALYDRIQFLEHESAFRCNQINELFHQLQSVVFSSAVDDIRHVHSVLYEKSWTIRAYYWFSLFKQIKCDKNSHHYKYQRSELRRSHQSDNIKDEVTNSLNINSGVDVMPKSLMLDTASSIKVENPDVQCLSLRIAKLLEECKMLLKGTEGKVDVVNSLHIKSEFPKEFSSISEMIKVEKPDLLCHSPKENESYLSHRTVYDSDIIG